MGKKRQGEQLYKVIGSPALDDPDKQQPVSVALKTHELIISCYMVGPLAPGQSSAGQEGAHLAKRMLSQVEKNLCFRHALTPP